MSTQFKVQLSDADRYSIFNSLRLEEKISTVIRKEIVNKPGPITSKGLPPGTISQIVYYIVNGAEWKLVKAHQYKLPDDTIKGGPDPKYMRFDDIVLV